MKLTLINPHHYQLPAKKHLQLICRLVDKEIGELEGMVNLIFCDDKTIHRLNRDYRQKDKVTDVLTFTYYNDAVETQDLASLLGEVIISIPQTKRQARKYEVTFESEMYKLIIHGILHLRGYDHIKDSDFRVMKLLEDKIMKSFMESKNN